MGLVLAGVITEDFLAFRAEWLRGTYPAWDPKPLGFMYGEGGWSSLGGSKSRRLPDPTLKLLVPPLTPDLDCVIDPGRPLGTQRYPADSLFSFGKAIVPADLTIVGGRDLYVRCLLLNGEANDDGLGNFPEFWELGVFCAHPLLPAPALLMIAYATFPMETKTPAKQLENVIRILM